MVMTHFYVFCYIAALLTGVAALTVQLLSDRCDGQKHSGMMKRFVIIVLIVDFYDFVLYYNDHMMHMEDSGLILSFGGCLLAILTSIWIGIISSSLEGRRYEVMNRFFQIYSFAYIGAWIFLVVLFPACRWGKLILNIPVLAGLLFISSYLIWEGRAFETKKGTVYKIVTAVLLAFDAGTYFVHQTGIYPGRLMDLTILYLLLINVANIMVLYLRDFTIACKCGQPDEEIAWSHLAENYRLTKREVEVLRKVYEGETNGEIAEGFFISERTVKAHIHNIFKKMQVKNRMEAFCLIRNSMKK